MKRFSSLGEGRGASPPHTRQPMAYIYELCIMQASSPSKGEEEASEHRHECHPCLSLGGAQASFLAANAKANIWHAGWGTRDDHDAENDSHLDWS